MNTPVPQPPGLPIIGNLYDIDPQNKLASLSHLADQYGPIFKINVFGNERYFVSSAAMAAELCDEKRFIKDHRGALEQLRPGIGAGLFTAAHGEHDWEVAHRTLVPAFGPMGIQNMFDEMYDIATQLVSKWARMGPDAPINVTEDYTRLTLDSIALCAMDKRFNSFYSNEMHPFIGAMTEFLVEGGRRTSRTRIESLLNRSAERKFQADISLMRSVAQEVIDYRRANPTEKKDLLNALLFGKDPKTGERMTDENIMNNMLTFLIAGHETTSGLLSFATCLLLKNPSALQRAQKEVDDVVGKGQVKFEHMSKLPYIEAVLRESIRTYPSAPAIAFRARPDVTGPVILDGQYNIPKDATIALLLPNLQKDPAVYGADANEFKPERMYGENFAKLPPGAFKPFGNGARGCIGRPFAWQEAVLTLALILQNFNLRMYDPAYELRIKQTLTIKPDGFMMYARLRDGVDPIYLERKLFSGTTEQHTVKPKQTTSKLENGKPMTILYGSNSGTCEGLAQSMASDSPSRGYNATVKSLDAAVESVPTDQPIIIISASYEGNPPDNANQFVEWLKNTDKNKFSGAKFAVFGCGHRDWATTYQKVPALIDQEMKKRGATAIVERGETNAAEGTIFDDFDGWADQVWSKISAGSVEDAVDGLDMELSTGTRASHLRYSVHDALLLKNEVLTAPGVPEKRHVELKLPSTMAYEAGDYIAVLPVNNMPTVSRVLNRFGLPWDASMTLRKNAHSTIPTEKVLSVTAVLGAYVELSGTATKKNLTVLAKYGADEEKLSKLSSKSVLDILEALPEIQLPFAVYLSMLTPMRIRQYSISSSPLHDPTIASITYSIVESEGHLGVATNYLRQLQPGAIVQVSIKKSHTSFHLPLEDETPVIMLAAGTGLAPFHGFVQERAAKFAAGKTLGEAALFIGCRNSKDDKIYAEELAKWEAAGVVKLFYAYSRETEKSEGCKYAQDRLWHEKDYATKLFKAGARAYICGSGSLGRGIADTVAKIAVANAKADGKEITHEAGLQWWTNLRNERYAVDVFD